MWGFVGMQATSMSPLVLEVSLSYGQGTGPRRRSLTAFIGISQLVELQKKIRHIRHAFEGFPAMPRAKVVKRTDN